MGLVLNRPTDTRVADALPILANLTGETETVYLGGPVAIESVLAVAELEYPADASELLFESVGFVQEPDVAVRRGRVFVGYAGWTAGQLEAELEEEAWLVVPAAPDDVFDDAPDELWSAVLRRQGGAFAVLALMPPDPSMN
jgi:putative transcriptional regulator